MAEILASVPGQIAQSIRDLRKQRGWSQEALATRMRALGQESWLQTTVAKAESVTKPRALTPQELIALAHAFGLPNVESLLGTDSPIPRALLQNFVARTNEQFERDLKTAREIIPRIVGEEHAAKVLEEFENQVAKGMASIDEKRAALEAEERMASDRLARIDRSMSALESRLAGESRE